MHSGGRGRRTDAAWVVSRRVATRGRGASPPSPVHSGIPHDRRASTSTAAAAGGGTPRALTDGNAGGRVDQPHVGDGDPGGLLRPRCQRLVVASRRRRGTATVAAAPFAATPAVDPTVVHSARSSHGEPQSVLPAAAGRRRSCRRRQRHRLPRGNRQLDVA